MGHIQQLSDGTARGAARRPQRAEEQHDCYGTSRKHEVTHGAAELPLNAG